MSNYIGTFKITTNGITSINNKDEKEDVKEDVKEDEKEEDKTKDFVKEIKKRNKQKKEEKKKKNVIIKTDATKQIGEGEGEGEDEEEEDINKKKESIIINDLNKIPEEKIKKAFKVLDDEKDDENKDKRPVYEVGNLYKKFKNDPLEAIINSVDPADEPDDIREFNQRTKVVDRIIDRVNNLNHIKDLEYQNSYIDFLKIVHSNLNPSNIPAFKTTMLGEGVVSTSFNPRIIEMPNNNNIQQQEQRKTKISLTKTDKEEEEDEDEDDDIFERNEPKYRKTNLQQLAGKFRLQEANEQDIKDYRFTKEIQNIVDTSAVQGRIEMTPAILSAVSYALTALSTRDEILFPPERIKLDNFIPNQQVRHRFANLVSICGIINNIRAPNQYYHNRAIDDRNHEGYNLITSMINFFIWNNEDEIYEIRKSNQLSQQQQHFRPTYYSSQSSASNRLKSFLFRSRR